MSITNQSIYCNLCTGVAVDKLQVGDTPTVTVSEYVPPPGHPGTLEVAFNLIYTDRFAEVEAVAPPDLLFSIAYSCAALSICVRLFIQAFACVVALALTKFGMAIAAKRPMMATTIIISTSVNPDCFLEYDFILFLYVCIIEAEVAL